MSTPIQSFIDNYYDLNNYLINNAQISQSVELNEHYKKILLLSCTSFYETQVINIIQEFVKNNINDVRIFEILKNKAIKRQYHTFFDWTQSKNVNNFLGLFGEEYKNKISKMIKEDEELSNQAEAFLILGGERNKMVHGNFLEYQLDKTFEEIIALHNKAEQFIKFMQLSFLK